MASDDDFESSTGNTSSEDAEYKYAQIAVPAFKFDATSTDVDTDDTDATSTNSGSSFLRLGSFPSLTGTEPSGFSDSLTLAKIVGDATALDAYKNIEDDVSKDTVSESTNTLNEDPFKGSKLLGFADDTRIRDDEDSAVLQVDGATKTNSTANRKTETKRLLTKGGWWDHAGGNRISTTAGDKIEIIQGNYKLVVLGRRAASDTSDVKTVDVSGGYEFSKRYEYLEDEGVWATYEESTTTTYATKKSCGKEMTYFTGEHKETVIGKDPTDYTIWTTSAKDPAVISKTWAKRVETYTGSEDKPVPHVVILTYANFMEDVRFCTGTHLTTRAAGGSLVSTNLAAVNVTSINSALTTASMNLAPFAFEAKIGKVFTYNTSRTYSNGNHLSIFGWQQTVALKRDDLTALKTEVNNYAARLALEATNVGLNINGLGNQVTNISGISNINIAGNHLFF
jgi:hypothetical protein